MRDPLLRRDDGILRALYIGGCALRCGHSGIVLLFGNYVAFDQSFISLHVILRFHVIANSGLHLGPRSIEVLVSGGNSRLGVLNICLCRLDLALGRDGSYRNAVVCCCSLRLRVGKLSVCAIERDLIVAGIAFNQNLSGLDFLVVLNIYCRDVASHSRSNLADVAVDLCVISVFVLARVQPPQKSAKCGYHDNKRSDPLQAVLALRSSRRSLFLFAGLLQILRRRSLGGTCARRSFDGLQPACATIC